MDVHGTMDSNGSLKGEICKNGNSTKYKSHRMEVHRYTYTSKRRFNCPLMRIVYINFKEAVINYNNLIVLRGCCVRR